MHSNMSPIRFFFPNIFIILIFQASLIAQSYKTAGGIRIDNGLNLTLKQYLVHGWAAEGILHTSVGSRDLGLTMLAEKHHRILFRGINLYYGLGAHYYWQNEPARRTEEYTENIYGASFIGGAEVSLGRVNVSIDWKPELHLNGGGFDWNGSAISVRYIFAKRERERRGVRDWKVWEDLGMRKSEDRPRRRSSREQERPSKSPHKWF